MLPIISDGHAAFQDTFVSDFLKFYPDPFSISKATWKTIVQFLHFDLSSTDSLLTEYYGKRDPSPRSPSAMLRSYLLSLKLKVTSITRWVVMMRECPLYAILSGFPATDTPGIGTFYDFSDRLWLSDSNNFSNHERYKPRKVKKGKKSDKTPANIQTTSSRLLPFLERNPLKPNHTFSLIFRLFKSQFLDHSCDLELINPTSLSLAGDGTPVKTATFSRSKRLCKCREQGCFCEIPCSPAMLLSIRKCTTLLVKRCTTLIRNKSPIPRAFIVLAFESFAYSGNLDHCT